MKLKLTTLKIKATRLKINWATWNQNPNVNSQIKKSNIIIIIIIIIIIMGSMHLVLGFKWGWGGCQVLPQLVCMFISIQSIW